MSTKPNEARPPRMEPLARLPIFLALDDKRVVLAGGSAAAAWKAELLSATGAKVEAFAAAPSEELLAAVAAAPHGPITLHRCAWTEADLVDAAIAVGAITDDREAARFAQAARAAGVPVNVVDKPAFCDFSFGAIVNRSPLVVGISTDGAAPVFAQAVRARIEALLPRGFARWVEAARNWRTRVQSSDLGFRARRRFWQRFTAFALERTDFSPGEKDFSEIMAATRSESGAGSVTFVGAGPGDPSLLTLKGLRTLQTADVVLFDETISAEILEFSRREARKIAVGNRASGEQIAHARGGERVVRLVSGEVPGDEIAACRQAGIPVAVIPGVSDLSRRQTDVHALTPRGERAPRLVHGGGVKQEIGAERVGRPDAEELGVGEHGRNAARFK